MPVSSRFARSAPAVLGLLLGVLALGPALGPGFVLRYDMVFVPDPPLRFDTGGFPRAVPSDQVVALLSSVVPAQVVQKVILLGIFVLAASGAAALVPAHRTGARLAAAAFYAWNAYVAQRLLLGHWALLLGFAGLPWAVRAAAGGGVRRLAIALLPAAAGGFQAMLVTALTVLPVAALSSRTRDEPSRGRVRAVATCGAVIVVYSLPWLIPALRSAAVTDPAGVGAFAPRADGPFGTLGSLVTLGGIWNSEAGVPGQGSLGLATVRLILSAVALAGFARLLRRGWGSTPAEYGWGLAGAALAGMGVACAGAFATGSLRSLIGWWSGFGPLRDGQLYVAPLALAQAVGFAVVVAALGRTAIAAAAVPLLALPTFALGAFGRLGTAEYPRDWREVQAIVNHDPAPGALLTLPWGAYRAFSWNAGRVVLDPAGKLFSRPVLWNDSLVVGLHGGGRIVVGGEDPRIRRIGELFEGGRSQTGVTGMLGREGVRYVLLQRANENEFLPRLPGAHAVFAGAELLLLRL
ncbi:hypothetical protein [Sphaerisporangium fuscum]|uniref:hypothetical protein n=1 Tax=Sphaerisporangium fuscum TaxID=2835868 RepID=UPI001BDD904D|nr:hypothetical protein [Sphaerisporangium fuscum]